MSSTQRARRREFILVLAMALLSISLLALRTDSLTVDHPRFPQDDDHHKYIYLATNDPLSLHIAPFAWRPLVPTLARLIPIDLQWSFYAITFVSLWLAGVLLYQVGRIAGFDRPIATAGMLLFFSMGWATKFNLYDFWLPDAFAFLLIMMAISFALKGRDLGVALVLAIGAAAKESTFFVVPLVYTFRAERLLDGRAALRTLAVAAPSVAVLIALRVAIPALNTDPDYVATLPDHLYSTGDAITYNFLARPIKVLEYRLSTVSVGALYAATVAPCGLFATLLGVAGVRRGSFWALRFLPFVLLAYAQLLYAPVNTERLLVVEFPAVVILALAAAEMLRQRIGISSARFVMVSIILFLSLLIVPTFNPRFLHQVLLLGVSSLLLWSPGGVRHRAV
jgi:hypothetical protein